MALMLLVYVPKLIITLVLMGEDIFRLANGTLNHFINYDKDADFFSARRKFISQIGRGLAAVPFLSLIYGITIGKYNYKVIKQSIFCPDLPDAWIFYKSKIPTKN